MSCGAAPVTGGRRMRGGMGYGFGGAMGTNGPVWDAAWGGEVTKSGEPVTGGRRRSTRRGGVEPGPSGPSGPSGPAMASAFMPPEQRARFAEARRKAAAAPAKEKKDGGRKSRKGTKKSRKVSRRSTRRRRGGVEPSSPGTTEGFGSATYSPPNVTVPTIPPAASFPPSSPATTEGFGKGGRKGTKKSRKVRKMRGGGSVGLVGASFTGSGSRGIADYEPYPSNVPVGGAFAIPTGTR